MHQFFYEARGKEKLRDLINKGMGSRVGQKSAAPTAGIRRRFPRLAAVASAALVILGIVLG